MQSTPCYVDDPRVLYAAAVLLDQPVEGFVWPDWLRYDDDVDSDFKGVQIVPSGFFGSQYGTADSIPSPPLASVDGVPLLFGTSEIRRAGNSLVVGADLLASTYFMLTRYEEWVRGGVRDAHGRFPGKESLPYRAGFIDRPIVDEYEELLRTWAGQAGVSVTAPNRRFSVLLTHDVDQIRTRHRYYNLARAVKKALLGRESWRQVARKALLAFKLFPDPADNMDDVIGLDRTMMASGNATRCQSVYFFMADDRAVSDGNYDIHGPRARRIIHDVLQSGATVGLHASYHAGQFPEDITDERIRLEEAVGVRIYKNRHHFLAWRDPEDGHALAASGITWDSTLGYADVAGFRLGVCRPIPLFDPHRRCMLGIEEHPLIVMDCTLSSDGYMNLDEDSAFAHVCKLADVAFQHGGEFVVLWHNHVLGKTDGSYHARLYPRILDYLGSLLQSDLGRVARRTKQYTPHPIKGPTTHASLTIHSS